MPKNSLSIDALKPLIEAVQLLEIRLVESATKTKVRSVAQAKDVAIETKWRNRVAQVGADEFAVLSEMVTEIRSDGGDGAVYVSVRAVYELRYALTKRVNLSDGLLQGFADLNAVFNAWPYWREFVQSSLTRMSLPPVVLPVYRVGMARRGSVKAVGAKSDEKKPLGRRKQTK